MLKCTLISLSTCFSLPRVYLCPVVAVQLRVLQRLLARHGCCGVGSPRPRIDSGRSPLRGHVIAQPESTSVVCYADHWAVDAPVAS